MSNHQPFNFKTSSELLEKAHDLGIDLPFQESIDPLFQRFNIDSKTVPNRLAVQPMEGYDGNADGAPSELTIRRYKRFAEGGSGLIWFESTSVAQEGRSNPRQLTLTRQSVNSIAQLVSQIREAAYRSLEAQYDPLLVLQLCHSGRYSRPEGMRMEKVVCHNPHLDKSGENTTLFSDNELESLIDVFVNAARLAREAGFDAVDIKACHGYLINELLGSHTHQDSFYGGTYENRSRFLLEVVHRIHQKIPDITIAVRLNATDGIPYPYGFGVPENGLNEIDLTEPKTLIRQLVANGCSLFNITTGIPYHSPHYVRPFDRSIPGEAIPVEHPLEGISRLLHATEELQDTFPDIPFVGTGYSWLRQFWPNVGAAILKQGKAAFIGLGRSSLAYPDAPKQLMNTGRLDPKKACITCSRCTELMRNDHPTGCVVRDSEVYAKEYKKIAKIAPKNA